jgi:hypothetical protein
MGFVPGITTQIEAFLTTKGAQEIMTNGVGVIKYFAVSDEASNYVASQKLTYNQVFTLGGKLPVDDKYLSVVNDGDLRSKIFVTNSSETYAGFENGVGDIILEESLGGVVTNSILSVYSYLVDKTVDSYELNWLSDLMLPYGNGDNVAWNTSFNSGGFLNTAIEDMNTNNFLVFVIDGSQHAYMDGKSIKMTIPYFSTGVTLYGTYLNTNMNKSYYNPLLSDKSQFLRRFGPNTVLLFSDDVLRPNGGDPSKSWSTGYNFPNAPYTQGNKSLANFNSNGSLNKDTAVGIAYLDKGVIVIFNPVLYAGYVGRTTNDITLYNRNLTRRTTVNFICDLPINKYYRSSNPTFSLGNPIRISSIGLFNQNKELMAIGRLSSEIEKNIAQRFTFLVKLVI